MEPLISVIIPIYNMEAYLARCLDSITNNTYHNLEITCVDDGSRDASAEILRAYAEKDGRIVPIFKENGGVSSARNAGLDRMTGEYVTFVDPDDYVHPQYVEMLYRALKGSGTRICTCAFQSVEKGEQKPQGEEYFFDSSNVQIYMFSQIFREHRLRAYSGGRLICSSLTEGVRFRTNMRYGEDTVFFSEVCEKEEQKRAAVLSYPLYYYYQRENSLTRVAGVPEIMQYREAVLQKLLQGDANDDIYLVNGLRGCLHHRFISTYIQPDRETARECDKMLKRMRKKIWRTNEYGWKEKIAYLAFIYFPGLDWIHRVIRDPSIKTWAKNERRKRREEKKNSGSIHK